MEEYIPGIIYKNIEQLLKYRNIQSKHKFLSTEDFSRHINYHSFITIEGTKNVANKTVDVLIIMMAPKSQYATHSPNFKTLLKQQLPKDKLNSDLELMIVSEDELSNHIQKVIVSMRQEYNKLFIEHFNYKLFIVVIPLVAAVPKHEFASESEVNSMLKEFYKSKDALPRIYAADPAIVWLGARPGDVVRITRMSENSGQSIAYRIVIK